MTLATTERGFQAAIVELARILQWRVFFVRDSRGSPSGWPDLVLVRGDRLLFRELKVATKRTQEQVAWGDALAEAGQDYAVWTPEMWDTIRAELQGQLRIGEAS